MARILVIDNDQKSAKNAAEALSMVYHHKTRYAFDSHQGLELLRQKKYDIILIDTSEDYLEIENGKEITLSDIISKESPNTRCFGWTATPEYIASKDPLLKERFEIVFYKPIRMRDINNYIDYNPKTL